MDEREALEIQRRNFERQFGSLQDLGYKDNSVATAESASDSDELQSLASDAEGMSASDSEASELESDSEEEQQRPKVVLLRSTETPVIQKKKDLRLARSGRAATLQELEQKEALAKKLTRKQQLQAAKEDSENLENDLKLQRLLSESHILAHNIEHLGADLTLQTLDYEAPIGNSRRRILEQRIRAALATNSKTGGRPKTLQKMPMHIRKGMIQAREKRVADYEREAREAGIVLAKVKKGERRDLDQGRGATVASDRLGFGKPKKTKPRDKGLRINSVGKSTRNGLRILPEEILRINNKGKRRRK